MNIVVLSDTHGDHAKLEGLAGDVLIHCGDFCLGGRAGDEQLRSLDAWFARQRFKHILCTGGNHDFLVEELAAQGRRVFRNALCLTAQAIEIDGITFYGAPWVPELSQWAHYLSEPELRRAWRKIPHAVDVLITHTPPQGILDRNSQGRACGCPLLRQRVGEVRPRVHCFGHIHASYGTERIEDTLFVNAALVDSRYVLCREPIKFELNPRKVSP